MQSNPTRVFSLGLAHVEATVFYTDRLMISDVLAALLLCFTSKDHMPYSCCYVQMIYTQPGDMTRPRIRPRAAAVGLEMNQMPRNII